MLKKDETNITLGEAMEKYILIKSHVLSPSTIRGYSKIHKNNLEYLKKMKLNKLTNNIVQSAINDESINHKPKTVKNIYGFLTAVLSLYYPDFQLKITLPQLEKRIIKMLNEDQLATLIKAVENKSYEIPVLLALWLGLRQSEIFGLKWDCVDFDNSLIIIKQAKVRNKDDKHVLKTTKTYSSTRILKADKYIMDKIKVLPKTSEFLFNTTGNNIYKSYKRMLARNNLPDISFHSLRMLNASIMLKLGIQDKYAMNRGGWNTEYTIKKVYQQLFDEERNVVDNIVDSYFSSLLSHELSHEKEND